MNQIEEWITRHDLKTVEGRRDFRTELEMLGFFEAEENKRFYTIMVEAEIPFETAVRLRDALDNFAEGKNAKKSTP